MEVSPLRGIRVLDFSKVLAGPLCTQYLSDMGAEVIKVEAIGAGDDSRRWPPFPEVEGGDLLGTPFLAANRGKRSIAVDLKSAEGQGLCHKLAATADIVVESFGPGVAARLAIDFDTLRTINPRMIHCSISGFGAQGPMKDGKGYDVILQAFTGMLSITGEPGGNSVRSPFSPVDQATGMHALIGILAALHERHATQRGKKIEVSLFDTATGFLGYFLQGFWQRGTEPEKPGSGHESLCPYEIFQASDKALILGVANDSLWRKFCALAGLNAYVDDPRYATNASRVAHRAETVALVRDVIQRHTCAYWIERLDGAGIPCSPLHNLGDLSGHPHTAASEMVREYQHPVLGPLKTVSQPIRFDGDRAPVRGPAPMLGEHTEQVLVELGMGSEEIRELAARGVVQPWGTPTAA
ncbi:CaiB/BaiF CoA transferase family protein [Achromobacter piechaudii]|uniref:Acetyl-CoA:oxalate CoA-transferase n=1 Tax=Achromobacter piechaudii TaxID=72556 RepID=A0A6S7CVM9_9BURK|nr:CaiB/BaiF CoA-transferase family protein [Achromobacter piechaudii]CAB3867611.1 Acetyl-CoA:oxalate CoA-transferase [Achromobacter piechaudii]